MNLSEMQDFVRSQADTDETDAPDTDLTVYARAAYNDIQARVIVWPDKLVNYTVTTVADTAAYNLSGFTGGTDLEFVDVVSDSDDVLIYVTPERFLEISASSAASGTVSMYTISGSQIKFWPTPSGAKTYTVRGYRDFAAWPSGSSEPDLPRAFDEAICWYMLGKFYQKQEDLELASGYMRDFDTTVNQQIEKALRTSAQTAGSMVFGGDPRVRSSMSYSDWVKRSVEGT